MATEAFVNFPCIIWKIKDFYSVSRLESNSISCEDFSIKLILQQITCKNISEDFFDLYLKLTSEFCSVSFKPTRISIYLKDKDGGNRFTEYYTIQRSAFTSPKRIWKLERQALLKESENLQINGVLTIVCMLGSESALQKDRVHKSDKSIQTSSYIEDSFCLESLSLDLQKLFFGDSESDIILKCGDRSIPAHRTILSARSEVFAAMFRNDMLESHDGIVKVEDMDDDILDQFLHYIYSGKLSNLSEASIRSLYEAADKYAVENLKKRCSKLLVENVTKENAFGFLILADAHSDGELKEDIICFVLKDEKMLKSKAWLAFWKHHPQLAFEVYSKYVDNE